MLCYFVLFTTSSSGYFSFPRATKSMAAYVLKCLGKNCGKETVWSFPFKYGEVSLAITFVKVLLVLQTGVSFLIHVPYNSNRLTRIYVNPIEFFGISYSLVDEKAPSDPRNILIVTPIKCKNQQVNIESCTLYFTLIKYDTYLFLVFCNQYYFSKCLYCRCRKLILFVSRQLNYSKLCILFFNILFLKINLIASLIKNHTVKLFVILIRISVLQVSYFEL